jgi:DNA-binding PadR family transcriptional regulator
MAVRAEAPDPHLRRLIGLYALTMMEREGELHGYALSERIALRTGGAWRPAAGAVYPSLRRLLNEGMVRVRTHGRRRVYQVTPSGRRLLTRIRSHATGPHRSGVDTSALWAEVMGIQDPGDFLVDRFERDLERLEGHVLAPGISPTRRDAIRMRLRGDLEGFERRLGITPSPLPPLVARGGRS